MCLRAGIKSWWLEQIRMTLTFIDFSSCFIFRCCSIFFTMVFHSRLGLLNKIAQSVCSLSVWRLMFVIYSLHVSVQRSPWTAGSLWLRDCSIWLLRCMNLRPHQVHVLSRSLQNMKSLLLLSRPVFRPIEIKVIYFLYTGHETSEPLVGSQSLFGGQANAWWLSLPLSDTPRQPKPT